MRSLALLLTTLAVLSMEIHAQDDGCVATCIRELVAGCDSITDPNCICGESSSINACVQGNCSSSDQQIFTSMSASICAEATSQVGVGNALREIVSARPSALPASKE
ncbi:hypothetical protein L227DRAFT_580828 [Lentinus tigrinus ALCF2SS1-6]|uniref:CFEM domain-containing protein n=1 Tax=Lentinus tigrinus ALCF2SS1-6 TaxID=1328759 RepID=A0A5C2RTQ4_9APHY|nr:hypothetical protein L227DRAFT_580828 [Lentinus tigrinus ALCF2SS1-6]